MWSQEKEQDVITLDVISADTNFARKHKVRLEALARSYKAEFEIKRFDTAIEICIARDASRPEGERVGEFVIRKMYQQYIANDPHWTEGKAKDELEKYVPDPTLPKAIICDLDGILSLFKERGHRGPYNASNCDEDDCHETIRCLLVVYHEVLGYHVLYLSGREDKYRPQTEIFLKKHFCPEGPPPHEDLRGLQEGLAD